MILCPDICYLLPAAIASLLLIQLLNNCSVSRFSGFIATGFKR